MISLVEVASGELAFVRFRFLTFMGAMAEKSKNDEERPERGTTAMQRMNEALKAAMKMPPRKHKDEPKRGGKASGSKK